MRIAVIGAGISGLSAALRLSKDHEVTLYEAASAPGGHTNTVDVTLDGHTHPVDTGFLVYNHRTYPELVRLFEELQVPTTPSEMSFSVSLGPHRFEWCGSSLSSLFAQPANAVSPRFWRMLADIVRFNREAGALAVASQADAVATLDEPLGAWLRRRRYSDAFRDAYLLPMAAAIWSCPMKTMLGFPLGSFVRFFQNHGLLQVQDRPQWHTVLGGGREYVRRIVARLDDVRTGTPVTRVTRDGAGVQVQSSAGTERFDHAVFATHSPQTLAMLADADAEERALLGSVSYQPNRAWLHTDTALMPRRRSAWAAWNYLGNGDPAAPEVSVTYWLNRLQPLPFATDVLVSLNPLSEPAPERTIAVFDYEHPVFDRTAVAAQKRLGSIQGRRGTWFAGAWTGYGFHEDGLRSGLDVAARIGAAGAARRAAA
ncbi:NAD(P)/FAD-dependent oxidoreductase [Quisquiliibacterium transsilvanicum]|nr:FAD-dependent oxidoreductase [Quisquiliibacterium transsilvanicum]